MVKTIFILLVLNGFLGTFIYYHAKAEYKAYLYMRAFEDSRSDYESLARTLGKGVTPAFTCKTREGAKWTDVRSLSTSSTNEVASAK